MPSILDFEQRIPCSIFRIESLSGAEMHCMLCSRSCKADAGESGDLGPDSGPGRGFRAHLPRLVQSTELSLVTFNLLQSLLYP